jgi:methyl-accepting chemotaxis protein
MKKNLPVSNTEIRFGENKRIISRGQMQHVLEKSGHLCDDLDRIQGSILTVTDMNISIANAVQEQHAVVEEVNRNISEISNLTAQDARETTKAATELGDTAQALEVLVKQVTS